MDKNTKRKAQVIKIESCEVRDDRPSPETLLWRAVVERALEDFKTIMESIELQIKCTGAYSLTLFYGLRRLRFEIQSEYFKRVCEDAGIEHSCVVKVVSDKLEASKILSVTPRAPGLQTGLSEKVH